jgi:hypothetical protein
MKTNVTLFIVCCLTWTSAAAGETGISRDLARVEGESEQVAPRKTSRVSVRVHAGWGLRLGELLEEEKDVMKNLMSGYSVNTGAYCQLNRFLAIGMDYAFFHSSNSDVNTTLGVYNTSIHNVSPSAVFTLPSRGGNNTFIVTAAPIGYAAYIENAVLNAANTKIRGGNVGTSMSVGYDFGLSRHVMFGVRAALHAAVLKQYTVEIAGRGKQTVDLGDNRLDFSTLQLSVGLRFR